MVVFTDGWSNKGPDPETVSNVAKRQGVEIYSVGYHRTNDNQTPTSADALDVNQYTLEIIADSVAHAFSNLNFDQLIEQVRRHNLKCL
jgi:predicted ATP-grasp superfamily ATP-dependent carboligase